MDLVSPPPTEIQSKAEVDLCVDGKQSIGSRPFHAEPNAGLFLASNGWDALYTTQAKNLLHRDNEGHTSSGITTLAFDNKGVVVSFVSVWMSGGGRWGLVLCREVATVVCLESPSKLGEIASPCGLRWCCAEGSPVEAGVFAANTQVQLCICLVEGANEQRIISKNFSENKVKVLVSLAAAQQGHLKQSLLAWLPGGDGLAVSWGGDFEIIEWPDYHKGWFSNGKCNTENSVRRKVLLGIGGQLRALACSHHQAVIGTVDAELCFSTNKEMTEPPATTHPPLNHTNEPEPVIDLRGKWSHSTLVLDDSRGRNTKSPGIPENFILSNFVDRTTPPARLCLFWPCPFKVNENERGNGKSGTVLPLLFPIPNLLTVFGDLVFVSSSHAQAMVSIYRVARKTDVTFVANVRLTPTLGLNQRLQGFGASLDPQSGQVLFTGYFSKIQEVPAFFAPKRTGEVGHVGVKLSVFDITEIVGEFVGKQELVVESVKDVEGSGGMGEVVQLLKMFEKSVTVKLDRIEKRLEEQGSRIDKIEQKYREH